MAHNSESYNILEASRDLNTVKQMLVKYDEPFFIKRNNYSINIQPHSLESKLIEDVLTMLEKQHTEKLKKLVEGL